jgi:hypothetical protein
MMATQLLVVPKSIPMIFAMCDSFEAGKGPSGEGGAGPQPATFAKVVPSWAGSHLAASDENNQI